MPINWPDHLDRTPAAERQKHSPFRVKRGQATEELATEMGRLNPDDWYASTASGGAYTKQDGLPKHDANPSDPGFVVHWTEDGRDHAVACDEYQKLTDNIRDVFLWIRETRKRAQRPSRTVEDEFAAARLPPGEDDAEAVAMGEGGATDSPPPHEVLDIVADADDHVVKAAARAKMKTAHPDQGGSMTAVRLVNEARDAMLGEGE